LPNAGLGGLQAELFQLVGAWDTPPDFFLLLFINGPIVKSCEITTVDRNEILRENSAARRAHLGHRAKS
jgi:hypothetical protein